MNLQEAEHFFKEYNGLGFHMCRENPTKYQQFGCLNIPESLKDSWRQDLLDGLFHNLFSDSENIWWKHSCIIDILFSLKTNEIKNITILLDHMKRMSGLSDKQKILVLENMAGRTKPQKDGGCFYICSHSKLHHEMNDIMNSLIDSYTNYNLNEKERFIVAVSNYRKAYCKFTSL